MSLHQKGLFYWSQVLHGWQGFVPIWKSAIELGLDDTLTDLWNKTLWDMKLAGFYKSEENDSIVLQIKEGKSNVLVKDIYLSMMENFMDDSRRIFPKSFWKTGVPLKITLFAWLAFHDRNLGLICRKETGTGQPYAQFFLQKRKTISIFFSTVIKHGFFGIGWQHISVLLSLRTPL